MGFSPHIFKRVVVAVGGRREEGRGVRVATKPTVCYSSHTRQLTHLRSQNNSVTNPLNAFIRAAPPFRAARQQHLLGRVLLFLANDKIREGKQHKHIDQTVASGQAGTERANSIRSGTRPPHSAVANETDLRILKDTHSNNPASVAPR